LLGSATLKRASRRFTSSGQLLEQALSAEYGIKLKIDYDLDAFAARSIRRRLYQERDRARRRGDSSFDTLSVCIRNAAPEGPHLPQWEVWIVRRDWIRASVPDNDGTRARLGGRGGPDAWLSDLDQIRRRIGPYSDETPVLVASHLLPSRELTKSGIV
jgi:hypothetical protein